MIRTPKLQTTSRTYTRDGLLAAVVLVFLTAGELWAATFFCTLSAVCTLGLDLAVALLAVAFVFCTLGTGLVAAGLLLAAEAAGFAVA